MIGVLRLQLRRERVLLPVWIAAIAVLALGSAQAVAKEFPTAAVRRETLDLAFATPVLRALRGTADGTSAGAFLWFEAFAFLAVTVGLMNVFLATRHGRADEEAGRRELLEAAPIRRAAPLAGVLLIGLGADALTGLLLGGGFAALGLPGGGAALAGIAIALTGVAFLGLAVLAGELLPTGRAANGAGVIAVLVAYALRGAGDALGTPDLARTTATTAWPSWLSPIGWGEQTLAFGADRPWPLALLGAFAVLTAAGGAVVRARRDLGSSVVAERPGPPRASRVLQGPAGLAARMDRRTVVAWAIGAALLGAVTGPLVGAVRSAERDVPQVEALLRVVGGGDAAAQFTALVMTLAGLLAAAAAVQVVLRLRTDESAGRLEPLLAAPVSRTRLVLTAVGAGWVTAAIVLAATAAGAVAGFGGDGEAGARAIAYAAQQLPGALTLASVAGLAVAGVPRVAIAASWALYVLAIVVGFFGELLHVPRALRDASPFSQVPAVPLHDWAPMLAFSAVAVLAALVAVVAFRRRAVTA